MAIRKPVLMEKSIRTALLLFCTILILSALLSLTCYFTTQNRIEKSNPNTYTVVGQNQSNWRGTVYKLSINYDNQVRSIPISRATSDSVDAGNFPELYYNKTFDAVVYEYHLELSIRVFVVLSVLFLILFLIKQQAGKVKGC
jgi:hypothetical protein